MNAVNFSVPNSACAACENREARARLPLDAKVDRFIIENKGTLFLGLTVLAAICLAPATLTFKAACDLVACGLVTFSSLQIFAIFMGADAYLMDARRGEHMNALLGIINLCVFQLNPHCALPACLYNGSVGAGRAFVRFLSDRNC